MSVPHPCHEQDEKNRQRHVEQVRVDRSRLKAAHAHRDNSDGQEQRMVKVGRKALAKAARV